MSVMQTFLRELEKESLTSRKMLERVPMDKYDWKPHPKSMSLGQLATHVAEIPAWMDMVLRTPGLDFGVNPYQPTSVSNREELLGFFERTLNEGRKAIADSTDDILGETWVLRNGDQIYSSESKEESLRGCFCQVVHHRAQLGVYLRLLDVPIPGSYGPSADDLGG